MRFPVDQPYQITNPFNPVSHPGIDIASSPAGKSVPIFAPEACTVVQKGSLAVEGNYLELKGVSGMFYYFGHFATVYPRLNQSLAEGEALGIMGMTGSATGVHTHHEVRTSQHSGSIDPLTYYQKGETMTKEQIIVIYCGFFDLDPVASSVPTDLINAYVGKPLDGFLTQLNTDPTYLAHKKAINSNATKLKPGLYQV